MDYQAGASPAVELETTDGSGRVLRADVRGEIWGRIGFPLCRVTNRYANSFYCNISSVYMYIFIYIYQEVSIHSISITLNNFCMILLLPVDQVKLAKTQDACRHETLLNDGFLMFVYRMFGLLRIYHTIFAIA